MRQNTALIIVDMQRDFIDGSLSTDEDTDFTHRTARWLAENHQSYEYIITTQDWHIDPGGHFDTWPIHCRADTEGAEVHPLILDALDAADREYERFLKGQYSDGYSGFEAVSADDETVDLDRWLQAHAVSHLEIIGIATDHCVRSTVEDAVKYGFDTTVLKDRVNGVDPEESERLLTTGFNSMGAEVR